MPASADQQPASNATPSKPTSPQPSNPQKPTPDPTFPSGNPPVEPTLMPGGWIIQYAKSNEWMPYVMWAVQQISEQLETPFKIIELRKGDLIENLLIADFQTCS